MQENTDQNNSEYGHFLHNGVIIYFIAVSCIIKTFAKGYQSNTKQNKRKKIPLKYTAVNIDIPTIPCVFPSV